MKNVYPILPGRPWEGWGGSIGSISLKGLRCFPAAGKAQKEAANDTSSRQLFIISVFWSKLACHAELVEMRQANDLYIKIGLAVEKSILMQ